MLPNEIGQQMTLLFKDEVLHERELCNNPNFKLQSLRDYSCLELIGQNDVQQELDNDDEQEANSAAKFKYLSDESLYD